MWAFNVTPASAADGKPILPSTDDFTSGLITRPAPFPCMFQVRAQSAEELIVLETDRAEADADRWDAE